MKIQKTERKIQNEQGLFDLLVNSIEQIKIHKFPERSTNLKRQGTENKNTKRLKGLKNQNDLGQFFLLGNIVI